MAKILIVDDEKSIRLTLGKFLAETGHETVTAEDADAALALLRQQRVDLVVSDIVLPRMTGVELLQAIRGLDQELPVVMMTGEPALETAVEAVRAGAFDYLSKPISKPAILRVVEQVMRVRALQMEKARLEEANRQYRQNLERMVAERTQALRESEARLRTLFNETPMGIWEEDYSAVKARLDALRASGATDFPAFFASHPDEVSRCASLVKVLEVNDASARLLGVASRQDLVFQLPTYFVAESLPAFGRTLAALAAGQTRFESEMPIRTPAGERKLLYTILSVVPGHTATLDRVVVSFMDITERHRAEAALRASEERFRDLVEHAPTGIFIQTNLRFAYLNRVALRLFGAQTMQDLVGHPVLERVHPDFHGSVIERIETVITRQEMVPQADQKYLKLNGTPFEVEVQAVPFTLDGVRGSLAFFSDITERRRLSEQLRQSQKLEAIGQLAGGVAHDFNNILAAILMHLGLMQEQTALDDETRANLNEMEKEARRGANLTRQLLLFSRRSVMQPRPVDLNEIVGDMFKMLRRLLGEHITFEFVGKQGLPLLEADPGMLEQVVMNLCVNARDAMPQGGRLRLATDFLQIKPGSPPPCPNVSPGKYVRLTVTDTGTGMEAATIERIFEPFFTTKQAGKGTGLGLATVHGIVNQHGGCISVESTPGQGSTFRVLLPASDTVAAPTVATSPLQSIPRGSETILLVEDEAAVRQTLAQFLRSTGYHVLEAANGVEALDLWRSHRQNIHLLFTDMVMPEGLTGLELSERLRAERPALKVIITSGYSSDLLHLGKLAAGMLYLPKPSPAARVAVAVRECLDAKPK